MTSSCGAGSGEAAAPAAASLEGGARDASRAVRDLLDAAGRDFSGEARAIMMTAIPRLDDYQDTSYARHFLARLARFHELMRERGATRVYPAHGPVRPMDTESVG